MSAYVCASTVCWTAHPRWTTGDSTTILHLLCVSNKSTFLHKVTFLEHMPPHHPTIFLFILIGLYNWRIPACVMKLTARNHWPTALRRIPESYLHFCSWHRPPRRNVSIFQVHIMSSINLPSPIDHDFLSWPLQHVDLATPCGVQWHRF